MTNASSERLRTLGDFLRSHRERIPPSAEMASQTRRRTPGLRREEVAGLCAVSTTWYTWLEQGRPVSASPRALARIASALRLTRAERAYFFEIAAVLDPEADTDLLVAIPTALAALIDSSSAPTYLLDRQWNAIKWNWAAARLFRDWLAVPGGRNLLQFIFLAPGAKSLIVDWRERARRVVAEFRADNGRHLNDPPTRKLLETLQRQSPVFDRFWREQDVQERGGGLRRFRSEDGTIKNFEQISLVPSIRTDLRLVSLLPVRKK